MIQHISWSDFDRMIDCLSQQIAQYCENKKVKITHCLALGRGGLVPAVALSHRLDLPPSHLKNLGINSYQGTNQQHIFDFYQIPSINLSYYSTANTERILIIEDIITTGKTFHFLQQKFFKNKIPLLIVALFCNSKQTVLKKLGVYEQLFCCEKFEFLRDFWVTFPWEENKNTISIDQK